MSDVDPRVPQRRPRLIPRTPPSTPGLSDAAARALTRLRIDVRVRVASLEGYLAALPVDEQRGTERILGELRALVQEGDR